MSVYGRGAYGVTFYGGPEPLTKIGVRGTSSLSIGAAASPSNKIRISGVAAFVVGAGDANPRSSIRIAGTATTTISGSALGSAGFFRWVESRLFSTVQDVSKNGLVQGGAVRDHLNSRWERIGL